jgi:hypothetical protein
LSRGSSIYIGSLSTGACSVVVRYAAILASLMLSTIRNGFLQQTQQKATSPSPHAYLRRFVSASIAAFVSSAKGDFGERLCEGAGKNSAGHKSWGGTLSGTKVVELKPCEVARIVGVPLADLLQRDIGIQLLIAGHTASGIRLTASIEMSSARDHGLESSHREWSNDFHPDEVIRPPRRDQGDDLWLRCHQGNQRRPPSLLRDPEVIS